MLGLTRGIPEKNAYSREVISREIGPGIPVFGKLTKPYRTVNNIRFEIVKTVISELIIVVTNNLKPIYRCKSQ